MAVIALVRLKWLLATPTEPRMKLGRQRFCQCKWRSLSFALEDPIGLLASRIKALRESSCNSPREAYIGVATAIKADVEEEYAMDVYRKALKEVATVAALAACLVCSSYGAPPPSAGARTALPGEPGGPPVKLLRLSALIDGSGVFVFTRDDVRYQHKSWGRPEKVTFNGNHWNHLDRTPDGWRYWAAEVDLTRARIIERQGRDVIALEHTADGFDLYFSDAPNKSAPYSVTIAIPRR